MQEIIENGLVDHKIEQELKINFDAIYCFFVENKKDKKKSTISMMS